MNIYAVLLLKRTAEGNEHIASQEKGTTFTEAIDAAIVRANPEGLKVVSRAPKKAGSVKFEVLRCYKESEA